MTAIFVSYANEDGACAEEICEELKTKGYTVLCESTSLSIESFLNHRTVENDLLESAAMILIWSSHAAQCEAVARHRMFAERLKKLIVPITLDGTELFGIPFAVHPIPVQVPDTHMIAQLAPSLPAPGSSDALIAFYEQAAHNHIVVRKEAIDHAAEMLRQGEYRAEVLAVLEYLANQDLITGVREKAQEVLDADAKKAAPSPESENAGDVRHFFGVKCKKGHVSVFDKRLVCPAYRVVSRDIGQSAGQGLDELYLKCSTCEENIVALVNCSDYRNLR